MDVIRATSASPDCRVGLIAPNKDQNRSGRNPLGIGAEPQPPLHQAADARDEAGRARTGAAPVTGRQ